MVFFELAERFYIEFVPQVREAFEKANHKGGKVIEMASLVLKELDVILNKDEHKWFLRKMSLEKGSRRKAAAEEFKERYAQN